MAQPNFKKLAVYGIAEQMADEVWRMVQGWNPLAQKTVGAQLINAADSVGANIAEGAGRTTYRDNCRFVAIARGSLYETLHWLRRAHVRSLLKPDEVDRLKGFTEELGPRLNAYLRSLRIRARTATRNSGRSTE
jgi:four helix bundle protein